jgi:hypothetical protein
VRCHYKHAVDWDRCSHVQHSDCVLAIDNRTECATQEFDSDVSDATFACCRVLVMSGSAHRSYWSSVPAAWSSWSVYSMISARRCRMVKGSMIHTGSVTSDVMSIPM